MSAPDRLPMDPIAEARRQWTVRWGEQPAAPMAAVTSIMRAQQILLAELNAAGFGLDALAREDLEAVTRVLAKLRKDAGDFD